VAEYFVSLGSNFLNSGWQILWDVSQLRHLLEEEQLLPRYQMHCKMNVLCKTAKQSIGGLTMCCFSFAKA